MNAHNAPPIKPIINMHINNSFVSTFGNNSANAPASNVPIINCPSAPIFQTLALKQNINPIPTIISGQALTKISLTLSILEKGEIKIWYNVSAGSKPRKVKINKPKITVRMIDNIGPINVQ